MKQHVNQQIYVKICIGLQKVLIIKAHIPFPPEVFWGKMSSERDFLAVENGRLQLFPPP